MRLLAHAKVNLFLRVLRRRPDGYHDIETILHPISLADEVFVEAGSGGGIELDVSLGPGVAGPVAAPEEDLAWRAAQALRELTGADRAARIRVLKHIPIGAGLGGGSADAAAVLVALSSLWDLRLEHGSLHDVAASLGSDVPFFLGSGTMLATGRGDELHPLEASARLWLVLGISDEPLLTSRVYARQQMVPTSRATSEAMALALRQARGAPGAPRVAEMLHNELETAAFELRADLAGKKQALLHAGALGACVSGSGPTVFGVARDRSHAVAVASGAAPAFDRVEVVSSRSRPIEVLDGP